ncbi:MAG: hypothetical protein IJ599_00555, partial [Alphaproteobacteria bacterium]|nr:hypothetical protein [Alphaproteobacteria bacterium]
AFSDFCITEQWKFHLACLRNKDDAPRWIQDNYAKNGKVGFYEDSIWKYIPKAIISVCCDGNSDISPGAQPAEFRQQNWNALLLKKSIAQCQKYLQSGRDLRSILDDVLDALEESVDEKVRPMREELDSMQKEVDKKVLRFVKDEAKKYGLTTELPPLQEGEYFFCNDYKYWQRYFKKIGRSEDLERWRQYMAELEYPEEIDEIEDKISEVEENMDFFVKSARSNAMQTLFGSYNIHTNIDEDLKYNEIRERYFIKLAADELKSDAKYSDFVSDIDAAFDDVAIYTKVLDIFHFIEGQVFRPVNSGTGYFDYGDDQAVLLNDFLGKVGNVTQPEGADNVNLKVFAPWFDKQDVAGRVEFKIYNGDKVFFKNFPEQYKDDCVLYAYFFNGKTCYRAYDRTFKLDDKMNFVRKIDLDLINSADAHLSLFCITDVQNVMSEQNSTQENIQNDIKYLKDDKAKTEKIKKYQLQLGMKRSRDLFWLGFKGKNYDNVVERISSFHPIWVEDFLRRIKELELDADFDFLGGDAIQLGNVDNFYQYVNSDDFNQKMFSVKTLKRLINEACFKGLAEQKFPEDEILTFVKEVTDECLFNADRINFHLGKIEAFMPSSAWALRQLEKSTQEAF